MLDRGARSLLWACAALLWSGCLDPSVGAAPSAPLAPVDSRPQVAVKLDGARLWDVLDDGTRLYGVEVDADALAGDAPGRWRFYVMKPNADPEMILNEHIVDIRLSPVNPNVAAWVTSGGELREGDWSKPEGAKLIASAPNFTGLSYDKAGRQLVYCAGRAPMFDVYVRSEPGQAPTRWTFEAAPRWAPFFSEDGQHVYYSQGRGIYGQRHANVRAAALYQGPLVRQPSRAPSPVYRDGRLYGYDSQGGFTLDHSGSLLATSPGVVQIGAGRGVEVMR